MSCDSQRTKSGGVVEWSGSVPWRVLDYLSQDMKVSKLPGLRSMLAAYIWPGTYYSCQILLAVFHWRFKTRCYIVLLLQWDVLLIFVLTWQMEETFIIRIFHLCPVHLCLSPDQSLLEGNVWTSQLISSKKMEKGILSSWQYYFWINRSTYTSLTIQLSRIRTHQIIPNRCQPVLQKKKNKTN